eukprot:CAMPEP_0197664154 /NCGR_PEP_ID=MMETSP1338-20131121/58463_1 /TAXON_ID=43686 ORGANISM="Pelagodinium beii, Strain RCC1491" /NCGR_SAMPLE_ID=MMETSP1338 /ASSEMBLY_ACC=CAM_ASM_000754 /LENGTH=472 /DNA_ID=CAMNT_0043242733 /DNA_START=68 /DNA_END=1483 /DNA_ORIENTATION=+
MEGTPEPPPKPDVVPPPPEDTSTGFAFIRDLTRDLKSLSSGMAELKDQMLQLRADLERESTSRKDDTAAARREMTRAVAEEAQLRANLESNFETFQSLSKTWIGALGKDSMATKERLNSLDSSMEHRTAQAANHEERLKQIDLDLQNRCLMTEYRQLAASVAGIQNDMARDRAATGAAIDAASRELRKDLRVTESRLDAVQQTMESTLLAHSTDLSQLSDKVEALQTLSKNLARLGDHELLDQRVQKAETALQNALDELGRKASAATMKSVSDRVTEMSLEAHMLNTRFQTVQDEHSAKIGDLEKAFSKADRQTEIERARTSDCIFALEKELAGKTSAADGEALNARLTTAATAIQRLESVSAAKVSSDTFEKLQVRIDTMEVNLIRKADSESLGKTAQAVTEQARQLEATLSQVREHKNQIEVLEGRSETMKHQLENKAEASNVYSSDGMDSILRSYYSREEMDGIMSRVW